MVSSNSPEVLAFVSRVWLTVRSATTNQLASLIRFWIRIRSKCQYHKSTSRQEEGRLKRMAANYWESTQRKHWQFTRQQLEDMRGKLEDEERNLVQMYPLPEIRYLSIYLNQRMMSLLQ